MKIVADVFSYISDRVFDGVRPLSAAKRKRMRGLFATLTPDQQAKALAYRGPEDIGDKSLLRAKATPERSS